MGGNEGAPRIHQPQPHRPTQRTRWRIRTSGGFAIYRASHDDYQDSYLPTGAPAGTAEQVLDCACMLYLSDPFTPAPDTPTNQRAGPLAPGEQLANGVVTHVDGDHPRPTVDLLGSDRERGGTFGESPTVAFTFGNERGKNIGRVSGRHGSERAKYGSLPVDGQRGAVVHNFVDEFRIGRGDIAERLIGENLGILPAAGGSEDRCRRQHSSDASADCL